METNSSASELIVRFGVFELNRRTGELRKAGLALHLAPQPFKILDLLASHPGELFTREEIHRQVWAEGTFVDFEQGLNHCIKQIRAVLGDDAESPRFIETLPRRGYRFIVSPEPGPEQAPAPAGHAPGRAPARWQRLVIFAGVLAALFAGITWRYWKTLDLSLPVQRSLTQLTFDPGLEDQATWSPDGRFVAYASDRGGNFDIWVQPVVEGKAVRVTDDPAPDWQPDWSPVGNSIVFRSEREGGGLFVVPVLGGEARRIASFGCHPRWSPDGSKILFSDAAIEQGHHGRTRLYTVAESGGAPQEILASTLQELTHVRCVRWCSDGKHLSLNGWRAKKGFGYWVLPLDGGDPEGGLAPPDLEQQAEEARIDESSFQEFLPDPTGRGIFYTAESEGVRNVWKDAFLEGSGHRLVRLTTGPGLDTALAISADGRKLAFTEKTQTTRIWSFPLDPLRGRLNGKAVALTPSGVDASDPALSPDGHKLAYVLRRGKKRELREMHLPDQRDNLLLGDERLIQNVRWSRDGKLIQFGRADLVKLEESGYLLSPDQTERRLTLPKPMPWGWGLSDWSPDGRWFLLMCYNRPEGGRVRLCLAPTNSLPIAEDHARVFLDIPNHNVYNATYSPNGRWILFQAEDMRTAGLSEINVVAVSGGPWTVVGGLNHWDDKPHWSPDGKMIYFLSNRGGFQNVWGVRFDPRAGRPQGEPFAVTAFDTPGLVVQDLTEFSVAPDRLLLPVTEVTGNLWMLENVDH